MQGWIDERGTAHWRRLRIIPDGLGVTGGGLGLGDSSATNGCGEGR